MSIEDDQDRFIEKVADAMRATSVPPCDVLVFSIRGKEIQELLLKKAEEAEKTVEAVKAHYAKLRKFAGKQVQPPARAFPGSRAFVPSLEELDGFQTRSVEEAVQAAWIYRYLAAHVDEDRLFRLASNDLALIGLLPPAQGYYAPPMPSASHLHAVPSTPIE